MTQDEFFVEYFEGRKDFRNTNLQGIDFFTPIIRQSHPEFFTDELSKLILKNDPVVSKPIVGIDFNESKLCNAILLDASLLRSNLTGTTFLKSDIRFANFSGAYLNDVDFSGADLRGAVFTGTKINNSKFDNAKLDLCQFSFVHINSSSFSNISCTGLKIENSEIQNTEFKYSIINQSIFKNIKFLSTSLVQVRLNGASFDNIKFDDISSVDCDYLNVTASYWKIINSQFNNVRFNRVNFTNLLLSHSGFISINFNDSIIRASKILNLLFSNCIFEGTLFDHTEIVDSLLHQPILGNTIFRGMDLSVFLKINIHHRAQSSIDHLSIAKTISSKPLSPHDFGSTIELQSFIESCGIPPVVAIYMIDSIRSLSLKGLVSLMSSTFISYGSPDEAFATKLNQDLSKNGITTFFFPLDATFGEKLHSTMSQVNDYDIVILICSKRSLDRAGLQYELEKTIQKEAKNGGESYLIPIALDDYLFNEWQPKRTHLRNEIINRVVADFSIPLNYEHQFQRLLRALKKQ